MERPVRIEVSDPDIHFRELHGSRDALYRAVALAVGDAWVAAPVFVIETLYESGSPLSEVVRPMTGKTAQAIAAAVPNAVFLEANTDEAAASYEEAGNRQTIVIALSPVTYPTSTSATIFVGLIWGTSVTETPVVFQWNGSEWVFEDKLPACRRNGSDDPCQTP